MTYRSTIQALLSFLSFSRTAAFIAVTFSYYPRLQSATLKPIKQITASRGNDALTIERISKFVAGKEQELRFVQIASTISAAATMGIFSWPESAETHWAARSLWFTAMTLSFFSLISSHQSRLLGTIPRIDKPIVSSEDLEKAVYLITWVPPGAYGVPTLPTSTLPTPSARLTLKSIAAIYVWQSSVMQMSWAWVFFLIGLTVHVIRVLLPEEGPHAHEKVAIIFIIVISLSVANFLGIGTLVHMTVRNVELDDERRSANIGSITAPATPLSEVEKGSEVNIILTR